MHRCFIRPEEWIYAELRLSQKEEHHLKNVLRAKVGDCIMVFDGCGRVASARITGKDGAKLLINIKEEKYLSRPDVSITLIQALPRGHRMDLIVEKATELGISKIVPVISERVVSKLNPERAEERLERWNRVALSAAKQCGTPWLPEIKSISDFTDIFLKESYAKEGDPRFYKRSINGGEVFDLFFVGSLEDNALPFKSAIDKYADENIYNIVLLIGPEGDLTREEIKSAIKYGAIPVSFGDLVLRVETAAIYGMSILSYEFFSQPVSGKP